MRAAAAVLLVAAGLTGGLFLHRLTHMTDVRVNDVVPAVVGRSPYAIPTHLERQRLRYSWDDYAAIAAVALGLAAAVAVAGTTKAPRPHAVA